MTATTRHENGPEPGLGSWVYASIAGCPTRTLWHNTSLGWKDEHGCRRPWDQLIDPIDTLPPERLA